MEQSEDTSQQEAFRTSQHRFESSDFSSGLNLSVCLPMGCFSYCVLSVSYAQNYSLLLIPLHGSFCSPPGTLLIAREAQQPAAMATWLCYISVCVTLGRLFNLSELH